MKKPERTGVIAATIIALGVIAAGVIAAGVIAKERSDLKQSCKGATLAKDCFVNNLPPQIVDSQ